MAFVWLQCSKLLIASEVWDSLSLDYMDLAVWFKDMGDSKLILLPNLKIMKVYKTKKINQILKRTGFKSYIDVNFLSNTQQNAKHSALR